MKNKFGKIIIIVGAVTVGIFIVMRFFGVIKFAVIPTSGNDPNIKKGTFVVISNILPSEKFKFSAYNQTNKSYPGGTYLQRLVGVEYDIIEIKDGNLFVNDSLIDKSLKLNHSYKIDRAFANELTNNGRNQDEIYQMDENYFITQLNKDELNNSFFYERYMMKEDTAISKKYKKNWTADNFGPLKVPKGKLFFIGDNRNASLDSRYLGFVDKKEIVGRLIFPN